MGLSSSSLVVELASNDGYLLQYFKKSGIPCIGVEPTRSTAEVARARGLEVLEDFFGVRLATELAARDYKADLIVGNNVLAHVPDLNDFVEGMRNCLEIRGHDYVGVSSPLSAC